MQKSKLNILVSYGLLNKTDYEYIKTLNKKKVRFFLDSGAFTAYTKGKRIDIDEYCKFIKLLSKSLNVIPVQLDVIGDPEKSFKNYKYMLEKYNLTQTVPVYQRGGNIKILKDLRNLTDYILLGGIAIISDMKNSKKFVNYVYENVPKTKFHWLGFTDSKFVSHYKPYSVDSSNASTLVRFGRLLLFRDDGAIHTFSMQAFRKRKRKFLSKDIHFMRSCKIPESKINSLYLDPDSRDTKGHNSYWNYLHILNTLKLSAYYERKFNTRYYHSVTSQSAGKLIYKVYNECYLAEKPIESIL